MSMECNRYKGFPYPTVDCTGDKVLVVQADKNEVDINRIVGRIQKGLSIPVVEGEPFYGDVSGFDGLADAFQKVEDSKELFMSYPADVRERFANDPVKFVEFFEDPKNLKEAGDLGLLAKAPEASKPGVVEPSKDK